MSEITTSDEDFAVREEIIKAVNSNVLRKQALSIQIQECYDIMMDDAKQFPNQFCVEFGILKQMISEL